MIRGGSFNNNATNLRVVRRNNNDPTNRNNNIGFRCGSTLPTRGPRATPPAGERNPAPASESPAGSSPGSPGRVPWRAGRTTSARRPASRPSGRSSGRPGRRPPGVFAGADPLGCHFGEAANGITRQFGDRGSRLPGRVIRAFQGRGLKCRDRSFTPRVRADQTNHALPRCRGPGRSG